MSKNRKKTYPYPQTESKQNKNKLNLLIWGASPYVITGFGIAMKELLSNLYRLYPGIYNISQVSINFHGDFCEESNITGNIGNGRYKQWPAATPMPGGAGVNLYGQPKFLEFIRNTKEDFDIIFLAEDPFWVGGGIPGVQNSPAFIDLIRQELNNKGMAHIPIVGYFPIDGIPKPVWAHNLGKLDIALTYLPFGAQACLELNPSLQGRLGVIPLGVNTSEFYPLPKDEVKTFKRAMFGDKVSDWFMFLNVNRNQLRKLVPSNLIAFKEFKKYVPNSFIYLNMKPIDVGWNLLEVCNSLGLVIGQDVFFPPDFNVQKGLSIEDLNRVFNCADILTSTAVGGGWELAVSQAFATKTAVLMPANTSHIELCGNQESDTERRGLLYKSGSCIAQQIMFPLDNEVLRPLPDIDDMVSKMVWLYNNQDFCTNMTTNAYNWALQNLSWTKHIAPQFHSIFLQAKQLKEHRIMQIKQLRGNSV